MNRTFRLFVGIFAAAFVVSLAMEALAAEPRRFRRAMPSGGKVSKQVQKIPLIEVNPYDVVIPEEAGRIKEVYKAPNAKQVVVHIQDAHTNFEAQSNIAKIIEHLIKNYTLNLAAVEGSTGLIDTGPFRNMPNQESKVEVATYYMKKGRVTGPEYLSITKPYVFTLWGIEDEDMYLNNYDAFLKTIQFQDEMNRYAEELRMILDTLKARMYPPELKDFDNRLTSFQDKFENFTEYSTLLEKKARAKKVNLRPYKNFVLQMKAKYLEKRINFDKVDKERAALVDALGKVLEKEDLSNLVVKSLSYRLAKMTSDDYYEYLTEVVEKNNIDLKKYPNLSRYIEYSKAFHAIDTFALLLESEKIEEDIKEKMYTKKVQRQLNKLSRHLRIIKQMYDLSLSKEDVEYYNKHKKEFALKKFTSFMDKYAPKYKIPVKLSDGIEALDKNREIVEDFYKYAMIRDGILVKNTLAKMESDKETAAVMITGGFHTHGVTKQFKEKGISYIVISPRITKDVPTPYIEVMTSQQNTFQNMLTGFETGTVPKE